MKNLKKMLAMLIVFAMIFSTMSTLFMVSAYDDVTTQNANLYEAVSVLSDLGIVNGKDATNFGATDAIKRSEAAKMLVCALGLKNAAEASMGKTSFTDVAADHWGSGYINVASSQGLINGYGDGKFGPDDNVTYEQFLKMGMTAAGFQPVALAKGGFPTGYVVAANDNQVTKGVKVNGPANATRGDIAVMLYNLLSTPIMEQTGWGQNIEYKIQDGKGDTSLKTILTEKLNIKKFRCKITANDRTSITSASGDASKGTIKYEITDDYGLLDADYKIGTTPVAPKVGTSKAASYLGYRAVIYIGQDAQFNEDYVASIVPDTARVKEINLKNLDYVDFATNKTTSANLNAGKLFYWINLEDKDSEEISLASNAALLINGQFANTIADKDGAGINKIFTELKAMQNGSIKLVNNDTNSNDDYDLIYITTYQQGIVDSVDVQNKSIDFIESDMGTLSLNPDDFNDKNTFVYTLKDKSGANVELSSIQKYDVIAVAYAGKTLTQYDNNCDYMDIVVLKDKVTGAVVEKDNQNTPNDKTDDKYKIGSALYKVSNSNDPDIDLDVNGTFYLDIDGKILYKVKGDGLTPASVYNYGYMVSAGAGTGISDDYQLKMFKKDGKAEVMNLASTVKVYFDKDNSVSYSSSNNDGRKLSDLVQFLKYYTEDPISGTYLEEDSAGKITEKTYGTYDTFKGINKLKLEATNIAKTNTLTAQIAKLNTLRGMGADKLIASKIVDFKVNDSNNIKEITFPNVTFDASGIEITSDQEDYTLAASIKKIEYASDTKSFDNTYNLTDATKVFYIPTDKQTATDNFELRTISTFANDKTYDITLFDLNKDYNAGLVLLTNDNGFSAYDSRLGVIDRIGQTSVDGDTLDVITMLVDGKMVSYTLSSKGYNVYVPNVENAVSTEIDSIPVAGSSVKLSVGDAIQFTLNGASFINNLALIFDYSTKSLISANTVYDDVNKYATNSDVTYVYAPVIDGGSTITIQETPKKTLAKAASEYVQYMQFDGSKDLNSSNKTTVISSGGIKDKDDGTQLYIVARMYKNKAYDIIQYKFGA